MEPSRLRTSNSRAMEPASRATQLKKEQEESKRLLWQGRTVKAEEHGKRYGSGKKNSFDETQLKQTALPPDHTTLVWHTGHFMFTSLRLYSL